jgi:3-oxoacyl-[acyl-carrier-protein] synthase II
VLDPVAITGMAVVSAYGRGGVAHLQGVLSGKPAFTPVCRFDVSGRRVAVAATLADSADLRDELTGVIAVACDHAGLSRVPQTYLALHERLDVPASRVYTSACVAASEAVADAAAAISHGLASRIVVAAGYLVEPTQFALFDAGRALAADEAVRPFSVDRKGILLGDGVAAIVLESATAARKPPLAWIRGWGRAGDAYHVVQPRPDGSGLRRAWERALRRGGVSPGDVGYINAHGSGSPQSDAAEAAALRPLAHVPVSSTKSLHGQALEASPLLELVTTVLAMREGALPVNAGFLGVDDECRVNLILDEPLPAKPRYALSLNAAFGGANTALLLEAA